MDVEDEDEDDVVDWELDEEDCELELDDGGELLLLDAGLVLLGQLC